MGHRRPACPAASAAWSSSRRCSPRSRPPTTGSAVTGLRLAALDEVPAEVDERGREGLARFIAELDLDLVCTSYLWDGAPGAWDGIDAHDLEAAGDGTVVAFPMLVRGLLPLPGDPDAEHDRRACGGGMPRRRPHCAARQVADLAMGATRGGGGPPR